MKSITATEFKAKCLEILDHVPLEGLAITKRGVKVATIYPETRDIRSLYGVHSEFAVQGDDLLSTGVEWDAQS